MSARKSGETLTIVAIKAKGGNYAISFSNGDKLELGVDTFTEFRLYVDKRLDWDEYERLLSYGKMEEAYRLALKRLGRDSYSKREIKDYLLGKGEDPEIVEKVLDRLVGADLLNDERYAATFAEDVADLRLYGKNQVLFLLRQKGISPKIIERLSFPREKELDKATRYAKAADARYRRTPKGKRVYKIASALIRRGFEEGVAFEAASASATSDDPKEMKADLTKAMELAIAKYSRKYDGYDLRQHVYAYLTRRGYEYDDIRDAYEEMNS